MKKHFHASKDHEKIHTKVFFTDNELKLDLKNNFALWKKKEEQILFLPEYNRSGQMIRTNFHYYDPDLRTNRKFKESQQLISWKEKEFEEIWSKSVDLNEQHFS